jgi:hypothetical protein
LVDRFRVVAIDLGGNIWLSNSISSVLELSAAKAR